MSHYHSLILINEKKFLGNDLMELEESLLELYEEDALHEWINTLARKQTDENLEDIKLGDLMTFEDIKRVLRKGNEKNEAEEVLFDIFRTAMWSYDFKTKKMGIGGVFHHHQGDIRASSLKPFIRQYFNEKMASKLLDETTPIPILEGQDVQAFLDEMRRIVTTIKAGTCQPSGEFNQESLNYFAKSMGYWLQLLDKAYAEGYLNYFLLADESEL
jgi:hypothetical protein